MAANRLESTVMVSPFVRSHEGNEVVIGDPGRGVYVAIPPNALDILDWLSSGETVGGAARRYESKHGQTPDIDDFLDVMTEEGFVFRHDGPAEPQHEVHQHGHSTRRLRKISLNWISPTLAKRLIAKPVVVTCLAIIAVGVGLIIADPGILPGMSVLLYPNGNFAILVMISLTIGWGGMFLHELAHATVARAAGVPVTLGFGNLMYVIVAQTDISGIRTAPKRQVYLAILAGSIVDMVSASFLVFALFADRLGAFEVSPAIRDLLGALLLAYLLRVSFQCFFYVRTDLYYLVATAFNCRNLMSDTERLLRSGILRLAGKRPPVFDLTRFSRRERLAIRGYTVFYLLGRTYAIAFLIFGYVPLMAQVVTQFVTYRSGGNTHLGFLDFLIITLMTVPFLIAGMVMWMRGIYRSLRSRTVRANPDERRPAAAAS